ncbi:DedA family protein [Microbacterium sp. CFH 90308]|uniref:DedA family protein n=1 Tax=Microbacterium salsuginis TaxID=2722803 RepID=A0ABX1KEA1_9MICO|nr:DedA family protein [Microbacterium sp. CFH 90308]NLP84920.1 DedA family protein [Microbacterium sp. CFH 90308]
MDLLAMLTTLVTDLAASPWVYLVVLAVCVIDGFFPPIPSETVVVGAATVSVVTGQPNLLLLIGVAAVGAIIGDNIAYQLGRVLGTDRWRWMRTKRVTTAVDWARRGLDRRGALLIFTARYIPVGRIAVNMTAGATGYPLRRFLPLSIAAGITWAAYSAIFGIVAGQWLHDQPLLAIVLAIVVAAVIGAVVDAVIRRILKRSTESPAAEPELEPVRQEDQRVALAAAPCD